MKIKLGKITYINATPIYYGLDNDKQQKKNLKDFEIVSEPPTTLNNLLKRGEIDISPISSASYAKNYKDWILMPNFSISCFNKVLSVLLVSRYKMKELNGKQILLTNESETGVALLKLLFFEQNIKPIFKTKKIENLIKIPKNVDAVLIIGDIALKKEWNKKEFKFVYDLGKVWYEKNSLPFVFAVWAIRKEFAKKNRTNVIKTIELLKASREFGYKHIDEIVKITSKKIGIDVKFCKKYYETLNCFLTSKHIQALNLFFSSLQKAKIIDEKPEIEFFDMS